MLPLASLRCPTRTSNVHGGVDVFSPASAMHRGRNLAKICVWNIDAPCPCLHVRNTGSGVSLFGQPSTQAMLAKIPLPLQLYQKLYKGIPLFKKRQQRLTTPVHPF
jgi:hypothetical protein